MPTPPHPSRSTTPPCGTQHKVKPRTRKTLPTSASKRTEAQLAAIREELKLLPGLVKKYYPKWTNGATAFQLECMEAQALGRDTILYAATGAGKTGIAAGPHLLPSSKGKVTLMISPLLSLHEEQVGTFKDEFSLKAIAINSAHGGCTPEIMQTVVAGEHQIVIMSPEMLLSRRFIDGVLRKPEFGTRCLSVFIDEAHCISHWGNSFRKQYGSIGIIRAFLPRAVPIIAVSATLTARVHQDILAKLQIDPNNYLYVNVGNDRPAVAQVVRSMEHPMNSYRDLDFLVRETMTVPKDIPLMFLYSDDTKDGAEIIDHMNARVHPDFRARGLVRPYNASMSKEYRDTVMQLFKAGIIRILVSTDAAGMGCDLSDVDIVIQWKAPKNMSSLVQRAGRAARGRGREGLALMLVERTAFEVNSTGVDPIVDSGESARGHARVSRGRGGRGRGGSGRGRGGAKLGKDFAVLHGQKRGSYGAKDDAVNQQPEPEIQKDAPGEGLYIYIQSTTCRAAIQATIFGNTNLRTPLCSSLCAYEVAYVLESERDPTKCCDICNPRLFDRVRPPKPVPAMRQQSAKKGLPVDSVRQSLYGWRREIRKQQYPRAVFGPHAILDDDTCEILAGIGPVHSREQLSQHLSGWARWDKLGTSLFEFMATLDIPAIAPRGRKRAVAMDAPESESANKRARTDVPSTSHLPPPSPALCSHYEHTRQPEPHASTSTPQPRQLSHRHIPPAVTPSRPPYPAYYSPYQWPATQMAYPYTAYGYHPTTPGPIPSSGALAGNPYAVLLGTPIPVRAPPNSVAQPDVLPLVGPSTQSDHAPPST
ncbi:P-loop containing nucleoside triphosphate hydrolase protein [Mycena leptocephala]|nr:P-loop containing nucleoside triphosphate hydrolase protein [Mycena leptocephala]